MRRKLWLIWGAAALGIALAVIGWNSKQGAGWADLSVPFQRAGAGLRTLALSGTAGNLTAWAIVLAFCALPALVLLRMNPKFQGGEDWLLGMTAPVMLGGFYVLVNPTLLDWPAGELFPLAAAGTMLSMAAAWLALKLLRRLAGASEGNLARAFGLLLTCCAALMALGAAGGQTFAVLDQWAAVVEGNTQPGGLTLPVLAFLGALKAAPGLLSALAMLWGAELAAVLGGASFGQEGVELCRRTALCCRGAVQATLLLAVFANLLQLALLESLHSVRFAIDLPLGSLMLSAGLFLLCRLLQRGKELQEDSDSII